MRVCIECGLAEGVAAFSAGQRRCKPCRCERERQRRAADPDAMRAKDRARNRQPERKAQMAAKAREHYEANRQAIIDRSALWNRTNLERRRQIANAHRRRARRANPEREALRDQQNRLRRDARLAGCDRRLVTERDLRRLADRQRGCCTYCGERRKLTVEHVIPLSRGGRHAIGNIRLACGACNASKRDRLVTEWRAMQRRFLWPA